MKTETMWVIAPKHRMDRMMLNSLSLDRTRCIKHVASDKAEWALWLKEGWRCFKVRVTVTIP